MSDRTIAHGDFVIERSFPVSPKRAFAAWADPKLKARWFGDPNNPAQEFDFRVGGREYMAGGDYTVDIRYMNIVPDVRIVYAYGMTINGKPISASLTAVEFVPEGKGTRMIVTEHGAFLDGLDNLKQREEGTIELVDALGKLLAE